MDGGPRQDAVAETLKQEIRSKGHRRLHPDNPQVLSHNGNDVIDGHTDTGQEAGAPTSSNDIHPPSAAPPHNGPSNASSAEDIDPQGDAVGPSAQTLVNHCQQSSDCSLTSRGRDAATFGKLDTVLFTFYAEQLVPFLFPFYKPSSAHGGKAWMLDMFLSSSVFRQAVLCQSSYYWNLANGLGDRDELWDKVISQSGDAFNVLGRSIRFMGDSDIGDHLHGAVRVMTSILQLKRFEMAVLSYENCEAHQNAAVFLFERLLQCSGNPSPEESEHNYNAVMVRLGMSPSPNRSTSSFAFSSAEEAAFQFSTGLLLFDDIVASTLSQETPRLFKYHHGLLRGPTNMIPTIDLELITGCQTWVLLYIGEIASLDSWKQDCKRSGSLDVIDLVKRATDIKTALTERLTHVEISTTNRSETCTNFLDVLAPRPEQQSALVTRCWAHAALIYLSVVVSGWQPANRDVCYHVSQIIQLLLHEIRPRALLRTMVWPFCVAGCLAQPAQEALFQEMMNYLKVDGAFGTLRKAFEVMQHVWLNRNSEESVHWDLATCFKSQGDLVFLV